jgi:hypothetical protein
MLRREIRAAWCALAVVGAAATGCSAGPHVGSDASAATPRQVAELRALERPVVRGLKLGFIALSHRSGAAAARRLGDAATAADRVSAWLDDHESFVEANKATLDCAEHTLPDLGELVERDRPSLRRGSLPPARERALRVQIAETVNCIQSSD